MPGDYDRLAAEVRARRSELRLHQDLTPVGGPGHVTVRKIEQGVPCRLRAHTKTQLETALQWSGGTVDRILTGSQPEPVRHDLTAQVRDLYDRLAADSLGPDTYRLGSELLAYLARAEERWTRGYDD